jgi:hypothetical protein
MMKMPDLGSPARPAKVQADKLAEFILQLAR